LSVQDEGTRDAITAQLQQHALLTRKMDSLKNDSSSSDESSDDDDDDDDDGSNLEAKLLNRGKEKIRKVLEEDNAIPKSGVFSLPFMVRFEFYIVFLFVHLVIKCNFSCIHSHHHISSLIYRSVL
jgi:U3 small nucleolar RNA-associated protein 14